MTLGPACCLHRKALVQLSTNVIKLFFSVCCTNIGITSIQILQLCANNGV
jgi:hypothetical protein